MMDLSCFKTHDLTQQQQAELMKRKESKFLLSRHQLQKWITQLSDDYTLLQIDEHRQFRYQSLYFDTDDFGFYRMHHNGQLSRFKVRVRRYLDANLCFLEVKQKHNTSITTKYRIALNDDSEFTSSDEFTQAYINHRFSSLKASLHVEYRRCTLLNREGTERVTIDTDLMFYSARNQRRCSLDNLAIIEIKCEHNTKRSLAYQQLRTSGILEASFSKYCIGLSLTHQQNIKTNQFKPILKRVKSMKDSPKFSKQVPDTFLELTQRLISNRGSQTSPSMECVL